MLLMFYARCNDWHGSGVDISFCMVFSAEHFGVLGDWEFRWLDDGMWGWGRVACGMC